MTNLPRRWSRARAMEWRHRWDDQQSYLVPEREVRFATMLDWVEKLVGRRPRCVDLGCGTGAVSERLLARFPHARSVGLDFDPVLLRLGSDGLGDVGGRMKWVDADLRAPGWADALPRGRFDAALSSTALHWLTGPQLARCYRSMYRRLRPGGVLLNADQIAFAPEAVRLTYASRSFGRNSRGRLPRRTRHGPEGWTEWWAAVSKEPELRAELGLRSRRFPHEHMGTPTPDLEGHRSRLLRAGFREAEVVWSRGRSRILAAVR
jgi:SAM-dependent methyltransferase